MAWSDALINAISLKPESINPWLPVDGIIGSARICVIEIPCRLVAFMAVEARSSNYSLITAAFIETRKRANSTLRNNPIDAIACFPIM
jgi:hypothetical protein